MCKTKQNSCGNIILRVLQYVPRAHLNSIYTICLYMGLMKVIHERSVTQNSRGKFCFVQKEKKKQTKRKLWGELGWGHINGREEAFMIIKEKLEKAYRNQNLRMSMIIHLPL